MFHLRKSVVMIILSASFLAACASSTGQGASQAVEAYLRALVDRDQNRMVAASCADWESQAKVEYNSFAAVKLNLDNLQCQISGQDGSFTLVACTGSIIANYGAEDLEIDVAGRTYQAVQEGGEWRMCGYHGE